MNKIKRFITFFSLIFICSVQSQDREKHFGIKGGVNYSNYSSDDEDSNYNYAVGFYTGVFLNVDIDPSFKFQPEILFNLNRTSNRQEIFITDIGGNPLPFTQPYDFEYNINEYTISLPVVIQYKLSEKFYLESGPQLTFILDRNISASQILLDGTGNEIFTSEYDTFDFGVILGGGYNLTTNLSMNLRVFSGLKKRNNSIKSIIFNLGMEYNL